VQASATRLSIHADKEYTNILYAYVCYPTCHVMYSSIIFSTHAYVCTILHMYVCTDSNGIVVCMHTGITLHALSKWIPERGNGRLTSSLEGAGFCIESKANYWRI
jgi:hypothetical protein